VKPDGSFLFIMVCLFRCMLRVASKIALKNSLLALLFISCMVPVAANAFTPGDADKKVKSENDSSSDRSLLPVIEYGTDRVSFRKKLLNQTIPYYSPSLEYDAPSGFYSDVAAYYLASPANRWDELDLNAGWDFHLSKNVISSVDYTYFSYGSQSKSSRTALKNNIELATTFKNAVLTPKIYFDYLFGSAAHDASLTLQLKHEFKRKGFFNKEDSLYFTPSVSLTAGTFNTLTKSSSKKGKGSSVNESSFETTGTQFAFPLEYDIGNFIITPAFYYSVPFNQTKKYNATATSYFALSIGYEIL
jgi:hypothetical protein